MSNNRRRMVQRAKRMHTDVATIFRKCLEDVFGPKQVEMMLGRWPNKCLRAE